jgi:transposase-like protein
VSVYSVQFQKGLSLLEFVARYGTDRQCEDALLQARWGEQGYRCSRCDGKRAFEVAAIKGRRRLWQCAACGYQSSAIVGTLFEQTKLPLSKWFLAMYLMTQHKNGISALALKRQLAVSYPTAWLVKHKLMEAMNQREQTRQLSQRVELDDAYLGGERAGAHNGGRGAMNKTAFVAAVQTDMSGRPELIKLNAIAEFTNAALTKWADTSLGGVSLVVSDGLAGFSHAAKGALAHERHVTGGGRAAAQNPSLRWVNTILGNLKTSLSGTYHWFDHARYAHRYLAEFSYRFNRRFKLAAMPERLLHAAIQTKPATLKKSIRLRKPLFQRWWDQTEGST